MKIMAIDHGKARTGVAVSDETGFVVSLTRVVKSYNTENALAEIAGIARAQGVGEIVVGLPRNMDGSEGESALICRAFAAELEARTGLPARLWDERLTTVGAHRILSGHNYHGKRRKETVDAVAASLILEGYLNFKRGRS